jgi:hypothetical protein
MSFKLVSAVTTHPHRCEFCTANVAPFIDTEIPRPTGGTFHVCAICWGQVLVMLHAVARDQYDLLEERLASVNQQLVDAQAQLVDFGEAQAERDAAQIYVRQLQDESSVQATEIARLERDNADLRDGHVIPGSEVQEYADAIKEQVLKLANPKSAKAAAVV